MTLPAALTSASAVDPAGALSIAAAGWSIALLALVLVVWQRQRFDGTGRLVAEAAHELRGPLCAARLAIGALERSFADAPGIGARLAAIDAELRRAGLAVDDLGAALEVTRAGADPEPVDLRALIAESEPVWQVLARAHGAVLRVAPGERTALVLGDRLRLAQAIGNLVANGCEHGGGVVTVGVRESAARVRVEVCDQGRGLPLPPHALGRAGSPPWRAPQTTRGHGLAVAARVAGELGGRLSSAPARRGARMVLDLPVAPSPEPPPIASLPRPAGPPLS